MKDSEIHFLHDLDVPALGLRAVLREGGSVCKGGSHLIRTNKTSENPSIQTNLELCMQERYK